VYSQTMRHVLAQKLNNDSLSLVGRLENEAQLLSKNKNSYFEVCIASASFYKTGIDDFNFLTHFFVNDKLKNSAGQASKNH
jgi:hypothetical protein